MSYARFFVSVCQIIGWALIIHFWGFWAFLAAFVMACAALLNNKIQQDEKRGRIGR